MYRNIIILFFFTSAVNAQSVPVQLMLVDNAGFEKVNHNVKLRLTMSNDTSSTLGQYQEVHLTQSNEFGIISENIGSGVATTNSQVLSLEQFTFLTNEPIIQIELDTSSTSNQYYTVGYVPYNYPMVARRALSADSSNYSDQSISSEYADTAEFARNFNESFDGDTSDVNELQELSFNSESKILSISNGNQVSIGNGIKTQVESTLIEVSNSFNTNQWMIADSVYLYGISGSNGSNIIKALISKPDSIISTINVGFGISQIIPSDSMIVGFINNSYGSFTVSVCDLNGLNTSSRSISRNSGGDNLVSTYSSARDGMLSIYVSRYSGSYDDLYLWDLNTSSFTHVQISDVLNSSKDYLFDRYYSSNGINGQGSGWYLRIRNRWNQNLYDTGEKISYYSNPEAVDSTGYKYITRGSSNYSPLYYFTKKDSTGTSGSFSLYGNPVNFYENESGYYLVQSYLSKSESNPGIEQLFLVNLNNIGTSKAVLRLIFENWQNHPEADGNFNWVKGHQEFLLLFSNAENLWINESYRNGNFIIRVPYEE